jgi:hypothetical protein
VLSREATYTAGEIAAITVGILLIIVITAVIVICCFKDG